MDAQELVEKYNAGEREFGNAYLVRADLSGAVLSGATMPDGTVDDYSHSHADTSEKE